MCTILVRAVFSRKLGVNKLTLLPYYWSVLQLLIGLIYLVVYLSDRIRLDQFEITWRGIFMQLSTICLDGISLTLALTMNLITALIRFQVKVGL